jgi:hypothetical protein
VRTAADDARYLQAARLVSAVLGALTVLLVYLLAARLAPRGPALFVALLVALHPYHVIYSHAALTEATFLFALLFALACSIPGPNEGAARAVVLGCLTGLGIGGAFVVRPEALCLVLPALLVAGGARRALARATGLVGSLALVATPFLIALNRSRSGFELSGKKPFGFLLDRALASPLDWATRALGNVAAAFEFGHGLAFGLAVLGVLVWLVAPGSSHRKERRLAGGALLGTALIYLAVTSSLRVERRFALVFAMVLLPFAAPATERLVASLGRVIRSPRGAWAAVVIAGLASTIPVLQHKNRPRKPTYAAAAPRVAAALEASPGSVLVTSEERIPYYAGVPFVSPVPGETLASALMRYATAPNTKDLLLTLTDGQDAGALQAALQSARPDGQLVRVFSATAAPTDRGGGVRAFRVEFKGAR